MQGAPSNQKPSGSPAPPGSGPGTQALNALLKEMEYAQQILEFARICLKEQKIHTQLNILSAWPSLIAPIWRANFPGSPLPSFRNSENRQKELWESAKTQTQVHTRSRIRDLLEMYYKTLMKKMKLLHSKVQKANFADKVDDFKQFLTVLLNIWKTLVRLAIYDAFTTKDVPYEISSPFHIQDQQFRSSWEHVMSWIVCSMNKRSLASDISLMGLLKAEEAGCFKVDIRKACIFFQLRDPLSKGNKASVLLTWEFKDLGAANLPQREKTYEKVKSVMKMIHGDPTGIERVRGLLLITNELKYIRKPIVDSKNWPEWPEDSDRPE